MKKFKQSALLTCLWLLPAAGAWAKTELYIHNKTNWTLDLAMTQEGQALKPGRWHARAPRVQVGEKVIFGDFSRGAGIKRGKRYLFRTYATAYVNGETCQIELLQYLRGTLFHSHLWQGARTDAYQDPGMRDDRSVGKTYGQCHGRTIGISYQALKSGADDDIIYTLEDHGPVADDNSEKVLELMTFNVYMRPSELFKNQQMKRADAIAQRLIERHAERRLDALILSEVFDDDVRDHLVEKLKSILPYHSNILGSDRVFEQDGGVMILSRGPIVYERQALFGSLCTRVFEDCLSDKGGLFTTILIDGHRYNLIGTHLQAGNNRDDIDVRRRQLEYLQAHKRIFYSSAYDQAAPTLFGGDFNVALGSVEYDSAFASTWELPEKKVIPFPRPVTTTTSNPFEEIINSYDPRLNKLGSGGAEWLDYFLLDREDGQDSVVSSIEVEVLRGQAELELSDHFPVRGRFQF